MTQPQTPYRRLVQAFTDLGDAANRVAEQVMAVTVGYATAVLRAGGYAVPCPAESSFSRALSRAHNDHLAVMDRMSPVLSTRKAMS